jgi:hypothetical protein
VPHLTAAIEDIGSPNGEATFEYRLHLVINGIRATVNARERRSVAGDKLG